MLSEMIREMNLMYKYIFKGEKDYLPFMKIKEFKNLKFNNIKD